MDSHAAFAGAVAERENGPDLEPILEVIKTGSSEGVSPKLAALLHIARTVQQAPLRLTRAEVAAAHEAGASEGDVQLAVLIASAFSMYNRLVDGFRARTPPSTEAYRARAAEIADNGYSAAVPTAAGGPPTTT
jgi:hypothetical protein